MTELLEAAKELEQSQKDLLKIIPDNMEEWVCFNDPSIDAILRGTLLPKGSQDKYRKMAARVRKEQAEYLASMKEIWRREAEEYDRQNQLDESTDFDDTFDEISDNDFNGIIENNPFTDIEENIEQLKIIQEELPIQSINISQINRDIGKQKQFITENNITDVVKDIKYNTNLKINPDLSATKNFINLLKQAEPLLNKQQKMQFLDKTFVTKNLGISLDLLKPYSDDDSIRFINGHSRYIRQPFIFNEQKWFLTNNIYKSNVEKLVEILNKFIGRSEIIENSSNG